MSCLYYVSCSSVTGCVQNHTCEDLAPGWSEQNYGSDSPNKLLSKNIWHLHDWLAYMFGTGDVEQSDWAALLAGVAK